MECGSAFATGLIGAMVYQGTAWFDILVESMICSSLPASSMLLVKLKVDDPVDASPVHGFCGVWGCIAASFFAHDK